MIIKINTKNLEEFMIVNPAKRVFERFLLEDIYIKDYKGSSWAILNVDIESMAVLKFYLARFVYLVDDYLYDTYISNIKKIWEIPGSIGFSKNSLVVINDNVDSFVNFELNGVDAIPTATNNFILTGFMKFKDEYGSSTRSKNRYTIQCRYDVNMSYNGESNNLFDCYDEFIKDMINRYKCIEEISRSEVISDIIDKVIDMYESGRVCNHLSLGGENQTAAWHINIHQKKKG